MLVATVDSFVAVPQLLSHGGEAAVSIGCVIASWLCLIGLALPGRVKEWTGRRGWLRQLGGAAACSLLVAGSTFLPLPLAVPVLFLGMLAWGWLAPELAWLTAGWGMCAWTYAQNRVDLSAAAPTVIVIVSGSALGSFGRNWLRTRSSAAAAANQDRSTDIVEDLTRQVQHLQGRLGLLSECLPIGVLEADVIGRCRYLSPACTRILGVSFLDGFVGSWFDHLHPEDRAEVALTWRTAWERDEPFRSECRIIAADSGQRWLHIRGVPLVTDLGTTFLATVEDITEQRRTARQLQRYANLLEQAHNQEQEKTRQLEQLVAELQAARLEAESGSRAKSEFLANMSHEIRTPMTAILGFTDVLIEEAGGDLPDDAPLLTIRRNGEYLLELLNDILDLSKIEAGRLELELIPCSPRQIVADVFNLMQIRVRNRGLQLHHTIDDDVPDQIISDPTRLKQVLLNLVGNAVKFTQRGDISVAVSYEPRPATATSAAGERQLVVRVSDTGVGMSPEQMRRLFKPFSQADSSTTRRFGGTGLGLTICKYFVDRMCGQIHVESELGVGSTFVIVLPAVPSAVAMEAPDEDAFTDCGTSTSCLPDGTRILLAEDGVDNQRLLTFLLKKAGAHLYVVDNGEDAVAEALLADKRGAPFDVVLMDMQMPLLDGYEATRRLRVAGYDGPIVALTANAMQGDREKCLAAGCSDYACKPIQRQELLRAVARAVQRTRASDSDESFDRRSPATISPDAN